MAAILIVDDDADSCDPLVKYLIATGHQAKCCANGRDAMAAILVKTPDLIVLDLFMPEMDGTMFLDVIRSYLRFHTLPVIVLTGAPESPQAQRARALNAYAVLTKGDVSLEEIRRTVESALSSTG